MGQRSLVLKRPLHAQGSQARVTKRIEVDEREKVLEHAPEDEEIGEVDEVLSR